MTASVELTQDLVRFRTINAPGDERACTERLASLLEGASFAVDLTPFGEGRAQLVTRIGGTSGKPAIGFTGHLDTVPLGAQPWSVDPLAAEIKDGKLYGRGSSDMKSGVAAFVAAGVALAGKLANTPGVVMYITAGEETGCTGAAAMARETSLPSVGALVVAEPTGNQPLVGHKGTLWLEAVTTGVTAHGSMPEKGVNAVHKAARAITALQDFDFNFARHAVLGGPTLNTGTIKGGLNINSDRIALRSASISARSPDRATPASATSWRAISETRLRSARCSMRKAFGPVPTTPGLAMCSALRARLPESVISPRPRPTSPMHRF
jgi:succinyl-diaminopimelate desuccinylase